MPLSKSKKVEYNQSYYRKRFKIPKIDIKIPNSVAPKLPWYAGAGDHFGEVRNRYYAQEFFESSAT